MINVLISLITSTLCCLLILRITDRALLTHLRKSSEALYRARIDLEGHCDVCMHYDVGQYLRCMGSCNGCRWHPNGGSLDNWKWRGAK